MKNVVILENIRSAYNVGNIIRTADALGRDVRLTGYSPSPEDTQKVVKTSL
jgi:tRNA G18 (ribose-2'-O)-methylase SpoU